MSKANKPLDCVGTTGPVGKADSVTYSPGEATTITLDPKKGAKAIETLRVTGFRGNPTRVVLNDGKEATIKENLAAEMGNFVGSVGYLEEVPGSAKFGDPEAQAAYKLGLRHGHMRQTEAYLAATGEEAALDGEEPGKFAVSLASETLHSWSISGMKDLEKAVAGAIQTALGHGRYSVALLLMTDTLPRLTELEAELDGGTAKGAEVWDIMRNIREGIAGTVSGELLNPYLVKWCNLLEEQVKHTLAEKYRSAGASVEGARIQAESTISQSKAANCKGLALDGAQKETERAIRNYLDAALDEFIADLDREAGFSAYAPTVKVVQAAKRLAREKFNQKKETSHEADRA